MKTSERIMQRLTAAPTLGRTELQALATELDVAPREVFRLAVQRSVSTFTANAAPRTAAALTGAPKDGALPATSGTLGWTAGGLADFDFAAHDRPLATFLSRVDDLEPPDFEAQRPALTRALQSYLEAKVSAAPGAEAAAELLLAEERFVDEPPRLSQQTLDAARAFAEAAAAQFPALDDCAALASREVLAAKADALGVQFFVEGTYRQLREPTMTHRELVAHPISSAAIDAAKQVEATVQAERNQLHAIISDVRRALGWARSF